MRISNIRWLRKLLLPAFSRFNPGDVSIRHHYTGDRFSLHSFRHKGYWWHGRDRERETMEKFQALVRPGDAVFEVGAHIGYITLWLSKLVGPTGKVFAFEPGTNNLPYLQRNVGSRPNVEIIRQAAGEQCGIATLWTESLTGQNNSFVPAFEVLKANEQNAVKAQVDPVSVDTITLDAFFEARNVWPRLLKIDVEGFEYEVLSGARKLLRAAQPALMVEVQRRHDEVFQLLSSLGYRMTSTDGREARSARDLHLNTFCVPASWNRSVAKAA